MKAILFDFDGTLIESERTIMRCLNKALINQGQEVFRDDELKDLIGKSLEDIFRIKADESYIEELVIDYRIIHLATYKEDTTIFSCSSKS